jgi:hypothetical protein
MEESGFFEGHILTCHRLYSRQVSIQREDPIRKLSLSKKKREEEGRRLKIIFGHIQGQRVALCGFALVLLGALRLMFG